MNNLNPDLQKNSNPSEQDLIDEGLAAIDVRDYEHALKIFKPLAEAGNAQAQFQYGLVLSYPLNLRDESIKWWSKSAEQGNNSAILMLAGILTNSDPNSAEFQEGLKWLRIASEQGFHVYTYQLADYYEKGFGVPCNPEEAARLRHKAKEQSKNLPRLEGSHIRNPRSPGVIAVYLRSLERNKKEAEKGDAEAQRRVGEFYYYGRGVDVNYTEAFLWYKKAAEQDEPYAQWILGTMYSSGEGVQKNEAETFKWYLRASKHKGHFAATNAMIFLTLMVKEKMDIPGWEVEAYKWCLLAKEGGVRIPQLEEELKKNMTEEQISEAEKLSREFPDETKN